jgi:hypothetical protein
MRRFLWLQLRLGPLMRVVTSRSPGRTLQVQRTAQLFGGLLLKADSAVIWGGLTGHGPILALACAIGGQYWPWIAV